MKSNRCRVPGRLLAAGATLALAAGALVVPSPAFGAEVFDVPAERTKQTYDVTCDGKWTATSSAKWLNVSPKSGRNNDTIKIVATRNRDIPRAGQVTVTCGSAETLITVNQAGQGSSSTGLALSETSWTPGAGTESRTITVSGPTGWMIKTTGKWVHVTQTATDFTVTVDANSRGTRNGRVVVTSGNEKVVLKIKQASGK